MAKSFKKLKEFLDHKFTSFNNKSFIAEDPIQVPYQFTKKEDIEISGFLTSTIAWGQRKTIIKNANRLMNLLDHSPYDYVMNASLKDLENLNGFVHRTFKAIDAKFFMRSLQNIYKNHGGLQSVFDSNNPIERIINFRKIFLETTYPSRTLKHLSNPQKNSACKRINMFLRWMVRENIDFQLWKNISASSLLCPLDVHSGNVARSLGLLDRKQNDLKACLELTENLKKLDSSDPIKYDLVLFGLGAFENFK